MKFSTLLSAAVLAVSSVSAVDTDKPFALCWMTSTVVAMKYSITAQNVTDPGKVCGSLWNNLKRFKNSCQVSSPKCMGFDDNRLKWHFWVPVGCNKGMIHSTWWEATHSEFGALDCGEEE